MSDSRARTEGSASTSFSACLCPDDAGTSMNLPSGGIPESECYTRSKIIPVSPLQTLSQAGKGGKRG